MKYIVELKYEDGGVSKIEYLGNGSYIVNKEKYATITPRQSEAKKYNSYKRAESSYFRMCIMCVNVALANEYTILELSE